MAVAECLIRMRQISSPENSGAAIPRNSIPYRHECEGDDVNAAIKFEATQPRRPSGRSRSLARFSQGSSLEETLRNVEHGQKEWTAQTLVTSNFEYHSTATTKLESCRPRVEALPE